MDFKDKSIYYKIKDEKINRYIGYKYIRGYLISDMEYTIKEDWPKVTFGGKYHITYDPLNEVCYKEEGNTWCLILGTAMDTMEWHMDLQRIAKKCIQKISVGMEDFYDYISCLGGRHIIVASDGKDTILLQDATGMRSAYYHKSKLLISSHYNMIQEMSPEGGHPFMDTYLEMKKSPFQTPWMLPGNITPYENIVGLVPNHAIDFSTWRVYRFWPRKDHEEVAFDEAMDYIASHIKRQMSVLTANRKVMMQLTKGYDSRVSLSASREIRDQLLYYSYFNVNDPNTMKDNKFVSKLAGELGLNFKSIDVSTPGVDAEEREELFSVAYFNSYHHHQFYAIGNYMKHLPKDRIAVRSNIIECIRTEYPYASLPAKNVSYTDLLQAVYRSKVEDELCKKIWQDFFEENEFERICNYFPRDMFHWEYQMGGWMSHGVLLKEDWNFDTYMLFNCRNVLTKGLSTSRYYIKEGYFPEAIVERLWPRLYSYLPNTDYTLLQDYYFVESGGAIELKDFEFKTFGVSKNLKTYLRKGRYQGTIGFSAETVKKGDGISLSKEFTIKKEGNYLLQVSILVPFKDRQETYPSEYVIRLGDTFATFDLNECCNLENQVNLIRHCTEGETVSFSISLVASKDACIRRGTPGVINIRSVYFRATNREVFSKDGFASTVQPKKILGFQEKQKLNHREVRHE